MKKTYLFLADGFEDIEAIAVVDILRRGGVDVQTVSVMGLREVKSANNITVMADLTLDQVDGNQAECLICPGGMPGAQHLAECSPLIDLLQCHYDKGGEVAAICAAPALVLSRLKTGRKLRITCYPGFEKFNPQAEVLGDAVVVDGNVTTGKGPGLSMAFGLKVLEKLTSASKAEEVAKGMLIK